MSVRKNLVYDIINNISAVIFPVVTVPYVSRILGVDNIGVVSFANTYALYFGLVAVLGIPLYGTKEIAKLKDNVEQRSKLFSELFSLNIISSIFCSIIYIVTVLFVPKLYEQKEFLFVSGILVYFSAFSFDWFFRGRENFKLITIRSVVVKLLCLGLMFIFVRTSGDALIYCGISAVAILANNFWNFGYIIRKEVAISFRKLSYKPHLKPLAVLLGTNLAISVYTILDTLMLGFMSTFTQVGYYSSAIKVSRLLLPFAIATTGVMIPKISYALSQNDLTRYHHYLQRSFSLMTFVAVPISVGVCIIAHSFVPIFFGEEFVGATASLAVLSTVLLFVGISNFFGLQVLVTAGFESKLFVCILVGTILNFSLNLFVIPLFGAVGAAGTSALAELAIAIATGIMAYKYVKIRVDWKPVYKALICCLPMIIVSVTLPGLPDLEEFTILLVTGVFSYAAGQYFLFRNEIALELVARFLRIFKNRK